MANVESEVLIALGTLVGQEFEEPAQLTSALYEHVDEAVASDYADVILQYATTEVDVASHVTIEPGTYALLTFGALIFLIAGAYLQQISRLKVPGIEIEKTSINQGLASDSLGISK